MDRTWARDWRTAFALGALASAIALTWLLRDVLMLIFGAVVVAAAMRTLCEPLETRIGMSKGLSLAIVSCALLAILSLVIWLFGQTLSNQFQDLGAQLKRSVQAFSGLVKGNGLTEFLSNSTSSSLGSIASGILSWGSSFIEFVTGAFLVVFGGLYLAADPRRYRDGIVIMLPNDWRKPCDRALDHAGEALRRWLWGQFLAMLIVGAMTGVGLYLVGVPAALSLGILAGIAEFIPVIGPIAASIPVLLIAGSAGASVFLWAVAVILVVQQLESNVITPIVIGSSVAIAPAVALFGIIAIGIVFGLPGLLFGFPLAIVLDVAIRQLYLNDVMHEQINVLTGQKTTQD